MTDRTISHYRILEELGGGGMGVVYEAEDTRLGRRVALKLLSNQLDPSLEAVRRFQREARGASALNHPHICTIYDVGKYQGRPFIVMERMEGRTIKQLIGGKAMAIDQILELGSQIADALDAAHAEGLIHRDVKPANVFVTERGQAKLLDFGLVKEMASGESSEDLAEAYDQLTQTGSLIGTVAYMSPEQAMGKLVDTRSDLFSLGVMLYEMATGSLPFAAGRLVEIFRALIEGVPEWPSRVNPEIPEELERIIMACLEKDPEARIQSASEVRASLQRLSRKRRASELLARDTTQGALPSPGASPEEPPLRPPRGPLAAAKAERHGPRAGIGTLVALVKSLAQAVPFFRDHIDERDTRPMIPEDDWRRLLIFALVVALALGIVFQLVRRSGDRTLPPPAEAPAEIKIKVRRSVAVLGFQNLSGRPADDWLSVAFAETLSAELGASSDEVRVIAGENVARAKIELALADSAALAGDTLSKVRSLLAADYVILGSYLMVPGPAPKLRFHLNLQDAAAGTTVATLTETGTPDGILEIVSVMGGRLRDQLGIDELSEVAVDRIRATVPRDPEALRLYAQGLRRLRAYDFIAARDRLARAIEAEPEHPLAHAAMAETLSALGYDQLAREEAQKAFELSAELSREDRLFVEGRHHEMAKRWHQAIESYRGLYLFFPDNLDYGLRLATALTKAGEGKEAIATLERLRQLPAPTSHDARIDLAEAEAAESFSDYRRMHAAGLVAAEKGVALGARILEANGRLFQASALLRLGEPQKAAPEAAAARRLFAAAGDHSGEADALNRLANVSYEAGDYGEAKRLFEDALGIWRRVGDLKGLGRALNNVADTLMMQGDLAAAKPLFEQGLSFTRESGDEALRALMTVNLADLAFRQGDLELARSTGRAGVELSRISGYDYAAYMGLWLLGNVELAAGELDAAREHYEKGLARARARGDRRYTAYLLFGLGDLAAITGDLGLAGRKHGQAFEIRELLKSRTELAESREALALLAEDEGRSEVAVAGLREALAVFSSEGLRESEAHVWASLASVALSLGHQEEARDASLAAERLLAGSQNVARRMLSELRIARTRAALGEPGAASRSLERILDEARKKGLVLIEYEARLAVARLERRGDRGRPSGPSPFPRLIEDAKARNFLLIARKATRVAALPDP